MTNSLPVIGVQAVIGGLAPFTAAGKSVNSTLASIGSAMQKLERASASSAGGIYESFVGIGRAGQSAAADISAASATYAKAVRAAEQQVSAAAARQAEAVATAALVMQHAEEEVVAAGAAREAAETASLERLNAAYAKNAEARLAALTAESASIRALEDAQAAAALASINADNAVAAATLRRTQVVRDSNTLEIASNQQRIAAARVAAAEAQVGTIKAGGASDNNPRLVAAERELVAAREARAAVDQYVARAETELAASTKAAEAADRAAIASAQARVAVEAEVASAEEALAASRTRTAEASSAASAANVAAAEAHAAAVAAASQAEAAAIEAAGIRITAAETEVAAATEAAAAAQVQADATVAEAAQANAAVQVAAQEEIAVAHQASTMAIVGGAALVVAALAAIGGAIIVTGAQYVNQVHAMGAIGEATSAQVQQLSMAQLELSRNSNLSATALNTITAELVKAGISVDDVANSFLRATNNIVVASQGELKAADAANTMQIAHANFSATAEETANSVTAAVQRSALSFTDYATAMRQAGPAAATAGLSIQEFSAVIGTMGQQIKSGSVDGTNLRQMFLRLEKPTKEGVAVIKQYGVSLYDAQGKTRPFIEVLASLEKAFGREAIASGKITQAQRDYALATIFSTRAIQGAQVLIDQGVEGYNKMLAAIKTIEASGMAGEILESTTNKWAMFTNSVKAASDALYSGLDPYVNQLVQSLLNLARSIDLKSMQALGERVGTFLYNAFRNFGDAVMFVYNTFTPLAEAVMTLGGAIADLLNPLASVIGPVDLFQAAWFALNFQLRIATEVVIPAVTAAINFVAKGVQLAADLMQKAIADIAAAFSFLPAVANAMGAGIVNAFIALLGAAGALVQGAWQAMIDMGEAFNNGHNVIATIIATIINAPFTSLVRAFAWIADNSQSLLNAWGQAWSGMGSIVGRAVAWIGDRINNLLDMLSAIPGVGDAIGKIRTGIGVMAAALPVSIPKIAKSFQDTFNQIDKAAGQLAGNLASKLLKPPQFKDYAAGLKDWLAAFNAASDLRKLQSQADKGAGLPQGGDVPSGVVPSGGADKDAERAKKKLDELTDKANELFRDFNDKIGKEAEATSNKIVDLYEKANDELAKADAKAAKDAAEARKQHDKAYGEAVTDHTREEARKKERDDLKKDQEDKARIRDRGLEDAETAIKREAEVNERATDRIKNDRIQKFDETQKFYADQRDQIRSEEDRKYKEGQQKLADDFEKRQKIADAAYQKELDAKEKTLSDQQDIEERALKKTQDAQERALKDAQDIQERSLKTNQDQREAALKAQLDAEERTLKAQQDIRKRALDDQLADEERALKASQDQREAALDAQLDAEARARDAQQDVAKIQAEDQRKRAEAQAEYNKQVAAGVKQSIAQQRLGDTLAGISKDTNEALAKSSERATEANADAAFKAQQEARKDALKQVFAGENLTFDRSSTTRKDALDAQFEAEQLAQKQAHDAQLAALDTKFQTEKLAQEAAFDQQTLALRDQLEQQTLKLKADQEQKSRELKEQNERDLTAFHEEQEAARDEYARKLDAEARARERERDLQDQDFKNKQAKDKKDYETKLELEHIAQQQRLDDKETARKRQLDDDETAFHKTQEAAREALEKRYDDEDYQRKLDNINNELDEKNKAIAQQLAEEQEKTRAKLAEDIIDLRTHLQERIDAFRKEYLDKLEDIVRESGGVLKPLTDDIAGKIEGGLNGIRDAAIDATNKLAEAFGAADQLADAYAKLGIAREGAAGARRPGNGAPHGDMVKSVPGLPDAPDGYRYSWNGHSYELVDINPQTSQTRGQDYGSEGENPAPAYNPGDYDANGNYIPQFASGGIVSSRSPRGMLARVGERNRTEAILPLDRLPGMLARMYGDGPSNPNLLAVRAAEAMFSRGIGASTTITNNNSYSVNANYGRTQPEGTVRQDLSALVQLTK